VTVLILYVGWEVTALLTAHLMDAVEPELLEEACGRARLVPGGLDAAVRGRWTGRTLSLEVDVTLDPKATLADAAHATRAVEVAVTRDGAYSRRVIASARVPRGSCSRPRRPAE
jgi:divalent metal cation (Fe/Co/Zn/Cd) transporter